MNSIKINHFLLLIDSIDSIAEEALLYFFPLKNLLNYDFHFLPFTPSILLLCISASLSKETQNI